MSDAAAWEAGAHGWAALVRGEADVPFHWHIPVFFELLPRPGRRTVEIGCGEGRVTRLLKERGHAVLAIDVSPTLLALAREADPDGDYRLASAAALPPGDGEADLVVAFMSLQDVEDAGGAIREAARVLEPGGRFCLAILHPATTVGDFEGPDEAARYVLRRPYLEPSISNRPLGAFAVPSYHRPLETYFGWLADAGFLVERLRELSTRRRAPGCVPIFLDLRAVKR